MGLVNSLPDFHDRQALELFAAHTRLQAGVPVSILVNIASHIVCALILHPNARDVSHNHTSPLSPGSFLIAMSWSIIYVLMVALCLLLVVSAKEETKVRLFQLFKIELLKNPLNRKHSFMALESASYLSTGF